jgi:hypothetical protein
MTQIYTGLKGSKFIPIYGMFTKSINKLNGQAGMMMAMYHGFIMSLFLLELVFRIFGNFSLFELILENIKWLIS